MAAFLAFHTSRALRARSLEYAPRSGCSTAPRTSRQALRQGKANVTPAGDRRLPCQHRTSHSLARRDRAQSASCQPTPNRPARGSRNSSTRPVRAKPEPSRAWVADLITWAQGKAAAGSGSSHATPFVTEPADGCLLQGRGSCRLDRRSPGMLTMRMAPLSRAA